MIYLFFDSASESLLHVCYSDAAYEKFIGSTWYYILKENFCSDFVCYRVRDSKLFKSAKGFDLIQR